MSEILRVWDDRLRRIVAMKLLAGEAEAGPEDRSRSRLISRLLDEAQVTAQLQHPAILSVHDLGVDATGRIFFTMPLVKGRHFGEIIDLLHEGTEGWTLARALTVVQRVCEAMAYAHSKGVIHRDLKPSNIMVGRFGETYVLDWGLSRTLVPEPDAEEPSFATVETSLDIDSVRRRLRNDTPTSSILTIDGAVVGTPAYMAPEQAGGKTDEVGTRSDVYSLGAMLYQLLTGRRPYQRQGTTPSAEELIHSVRNGPPDPISRVAPSVAPELAAICEKAMAREPRLRYGDMLEMADDLQAYLEGRVVRAYRAGAFAELKKWEGRNRAQAVGLLLGVLGIVGGLSGILAVGAYNRRRGMEREALLADTVKDLETSRTEGERRLEEMRRAVYFQNIHRARQALESGDSAVLTRALEECDEDLRNLEWRYLGKRAHPGQRAYEGPEWNVSAIALSPDRRLVAAGGFDTRLYVWDVETALPVRVLPGRHEIRSLAFSPDGSRIASGSNHDVRVHGCPGGEKLWEIGEDAGGLTDLVFSPSGDLLAVATTGTGRVLDAASGRRVADLGKANRVAFDSRGKHLLGADDRGRITLWQCDPFQRIGSYDLGADPKDIRFSPDGSRVLALVHDEEAMAYWLATVHLGSGEVVASTRHAVDGWVMARFDPSCRRVAVWRQDNFLSVHEIESGDVRRIKLGSLLVGPLAWLDEEHVLVGDRTAVRLLPLTADPVRSLYRGEGRETRSVALSPGGDLLAAVARDDVIRVWDLPSGNLRNVIRSGQDRTYVMFSPDAKLLASVGFDGTLCLRDASTGEEIDRRVLVSGRLEDVAFDPRGGRVATAGASGIGVWALADGSGRILPGTRAALSVGFDGTGDRIIGCQHDASVTIWDARTFEVVGARIVGAPHFGWEASFSPDGSRIVYSTLEGRVVVADATTQEPILECEASIDGVGWTYRVYRTVFSPDGERILVSSQNSTVRIFDARTGHHVLTFVGEDTYRANTYGALCLSRDGNVIALAGDGPTAWVWDLR